jgi:hypothetical protein
MVQADYDLRDVTGNIYPQTDQGAYASQVSVPLDPYYSALLHASGRADQRLSCRADAEIVRWLGASDRELSDDRMASDGKLRARRHVRRDQWADLHPERAGRLRRPSPNRVAPVSIRAPQSLFPCADCGAPGTVAAPGPYLTSEVVDGWPERFYNESNIVASMGNGANQWGR